MTTDRVKEILGYYAGENPGVLTNLARILNHGRLGGTGRVLILPVDQGFEHGPMRSFGKNPDAFDPRYHFRLAVEAGLNAYAAPLGMLEAGAAEYAGQIPLILKCNSSNVHATSKDQAVYGGVKDALRLGCVAVGFTIYPFADEQFEMMEELRDLASEAKSNGLPVVVWSYPRGGKLQKPDESALNITAYAAHLAAELGAHVIKVKPPSAQIADLGDKDTAEAYAGVNWEESALSQRIAHVVQAAFNGRRIIIFSGGPAKGTEEVLGEIREVAAGGGFGSIVGRNMFTRTMSEAVSLAEQISLIYSEVATD